MKKNDMIGLCPYCKEQKAENMFITEDEEGQIQYLNCKIHGRLAWRGKWKIEEIKK